LDFNKNQLAAINHIEGPCCVIAGAGSGKTAVLINRIAALIDSGVASHEILAVTFSKKARMEMEERLFAAIGTNQVRVCTFHSLGYYILKCEKNGFLYGKSPIKAYQKINCIQAAMKGTILEQQEAAPKYIASFIDLCKSALIAPGEIPASQSTIPELAAMHRVYAEYEGYKAEAGLYDFSDMEDMPVRRLRSSPQLAEYLRGVWKHILVDEYQDTGKAQDAILRLIMPYSENVFVVGDDFQSIYSFRGANVGNILDFPKHFKGARMIYLDVNYRSTSQIVAVSNALIQHNRRQLQKNVLSGRKAVGEKPALTIYDDERREAEGIANQIKSMIRMGSSYGDMAVLYRVNYQSRAFEEALFRKGIPYKVQGGVSFYEQQYIWDVIDYLRLAVNPDDSAALLRILNRPNRYFGDAFRAEVERHMAKYRCSARIAVAVNSKSREWRYSNNVDQFMSDLFWLNKNSRLNAADLIEFIYCDVGYREFLKSDASEELYEQRQEDADELLSLAAPFSDAKSLVEYVDLQTKAYRKNAESPDAVTLATVHKVKGLEFPVVFVASCNETIFPHHRSNSDEEERRLMYVAMTRARDILALSIVNEIKGKQATQSRFIDEIQDYLDVRNLSRATPALKGGLLPP
jgi:DNA helicase-2/ATP-dependent DNA helicase PcrA